MSSSKNFSIKLEFERPVKFVYLNTTNAFLKIQVFVFDVISDDIRSVETLNFSRLHES